MFSHTVHEHLTEILKGQAGQPEAYIAQRIMTVLDVRERPETRAPQKPRAPHQHESWQIRESAKGGFYCAACGDTVAPKPTCAVCGGPLKPWKGGWAHVEHVDFKIRPHDAVLKEVQDA